MKPSDRWELSGVWINRFLEITRGTGVDTFRLKFTPVILLETLSFKV